MSKFPTYQLFGDHAFLITWEERIHPKTHQAVMQMQQFIELKFAQLIVETVPAYHSLAVYVKPSIDISRALEEIKCAASEANSIAPTASRKIIEIPVCYEAAFAPDIEHVAAQHKLTIEEVIAKHSETNYLVYFLGFLPGFPYLGGLDPDLVTARKATPRTIVPKGAVGIGGNQTGIYQQDSPGGWQIIGRTPVALFDSSKTPPVLFGSGDYVRFKAIDHEQFERIERAIRSNDFEPLIEGYDD